MSRILMTKTNKLFNKVMTNTKKSYILQILETYDKQHLELGSNQPIDMHVRKFYLSNRRIISKDREFINDQVYNLVKYKGLLDVITPKPVNWHNRFKTFYSSNFDRQLDNVNLPDHVRVSFPKDLFELLASAHGRTKALEICRVSNERAPLTVRANLLKTSRDELYNSFKNKGFNVKKTEFSPYGITFLVNPNVNFFTMDEFKHGHFEVQDEASQLVSLRVDCKPGDIILDYCGGSGGKSLAFAPFTQGKGQIFIHDIRKNILLEAKRRLRRAGVQNYQLNNSKDDLKRTLKNACDWILLDVPCTGTGTFRRNPDLKWKFSFERLEELNQVQEDIFSEALNLLKPNGKIVYVTCSLLQEENLNQAWKFCKKFGVRILNDKIFQTFPKTDQMDGFFSITFTR